MGIESGIQQFKVRWLPARRDDRIGERFGAFTSVGPVRRNRRTDSSRRDGTTHHIISFFLCVALKRIDSDDYRHAVGLHICNVLLEVAYALF